MYFSWLFPRRGRHGNAPCAHTCGPNISAVVARVLPGRRYMALDFRFYRFYAFHDFFESLDHPHWSPRVRVFRSVWSPCPRNETPCACGRPLLRNKPSERSRPKVKESGQHSIPGRLIGRRQTWTRRYCRCHSLLFAAQFEGSSTRPTKRALVAISQSCVSTSSAMGSGSTPPPSAAGLHTKPTTHAPRHTTPRHIPHACPLQKTTPTINNTHWRNDDVT